MSLVILFSVLAACTYKGTGALLALMRRHAILDHPNERSSHRVPTPKGGGIVVVGVALTAWVGVGLYVEGDAFLVWIVPVAALGLAALSWIDDLLGLSPVVRLGAQAAAVTAMLALRPESSPFFQGLLPTPVDALVAGMLWVWFINLFNFMDGIDGITGVQTLVVGLGVGLIGGGSSAIMGFVVAAAALGFLKWNWHPAKIFLGDVGSVPLGFLLGWLLLDMAAGEQWAAALILPAYYLADATTTLFRRALDGEKIWRAHRSHYYQRAVRRGLSHARVSAAVFGIGVFLAVLAWLAEDGRALPALSIAAVATVWFLFFLAGRRT